MHRTSIVRMSCLFAVTLAPPEFAVADQEVHEGSLSGAGAPMTQTFTVPQFDTQDGTRLLNFIEVYLRSSIIGGYSTGGSGKVVDIYAQLSADLFLDGVLLATTEALIQSSVQDVGAISVTVFDVDEDTTPIVHPGTQFPWLGDGDVTLSAFTEFIVTQSPEGVIFFGAGGGVDYSVTYDYTVVSGGPGDLDGDGTVGPADLALLLGAWGPCDDARDCDADLDMDGVVGPADLALLLGGWG